MNPSLFAGVEPLEVFVELLADIEGDRVATSFYDRVCEAICQLTSMRRAAIFMADGAPRRVRAVGAHGISLPRLDALRPTLADTPVAQEALLTDAVIVVSERIEAAVPAAFAAELGITTLVCTPMAAAGRGYGVICCDRGGGRFELSDGERHLLWTLGKTAALVATARITTRQQERAQQLAARLALSREIQGRVMQRLFAISVALAAPGGLGETERERCRGEMQDAMLDLRRALGAHGVMPRLRTGHELTGREREVLGLMGSGATNREIAAELRLSPHTVKEHTSAVYRKLGVRNRAAAVHKGQQSGLMS